MLKKLVEDYIKFYFSSDFHDDNDFSNYIFECAIETFYGKDIWVLMRNYYNSSFTS